MSSKENLHLALVNAFNLKLTGDESPEVAASAFTDILCAFAEVIRGPVPEVTGVELTADETPASLLAEMREQTTLLRKLADELRMSRA